MAILNGDDQDNFLEGTTGDDVIRGNGGNDQISDGNGGADQLFGGDGNDSIGGSGGASTLPRTIMDGGAGDDTLYYSSGRNGVDARGGSGNDLITVHGFGDNLIDGGAGNDFVTLGSGLVYTVTLGTGADNLRLAGNYEYTFGQSPTATVIDFQPGIDSIDMYFDARGAGGSYRLIGWVGSDNPFAGGWARVVDDGSGNTLVQIDRDAGGSAEGWVTYIVLQNVAASSLTAADFMGYDPQGGSLPPGRSFTGTGSTDTIIGTIGADTFTGSASGDRFDGGTGDDIVNAGGGDDEIYGGLGSDIVHGGAGNDILVDYGQHSDPSGRFLGASLGGADDLYGDDGDDFLTAIGGTVGMDQTLLDGGSGDDRLDYYSGDNGARLYGGDGNDIISVQGFGHNLIDAGTGNDQVTLGSGLTFLVTLGEGADTLNFQSNYFPDAPAIVTDFNVSEDQVVGFADLFSNWDGEADLFEAGYLYLAGNDGGTMLYMDSNGGGDRFTAAALFQDLAISDFRAANFGGSEPNEPYRITLNGTAGNDQIFAGDTDDTLIGFGGNDRLSGGKGADWMYGGAGDDLYFVDSFADLVFENPGEGTDTVHAAASHYLHANVENLQLTEAAGASHGVGNGLANELVGNSFQNLLLGGAGNDIMNGLGGDDVMFGQDGDDVMIGDTGQDYMAGGIGSDTIIGMAGTDAIYGEEGNDILYGDAGNDYIVGGLGDDSMFGGEGDDAMHGESGNDNIDGGTGNDYITAGGGQDVLRGGDGHDLLYGMDGSDTIFGGAGLDFLAGGAGDDSLFGNEDADALYGEDGNDTLWGGDTFHTDILDGGEGNDELHGDSGLGDYDLLYGGAGNDNYFVDTGDDLTFEGLNGGTDWVFADIAGENNGVYLYGNVENLVLMNTTAFGVGNILDNQLYGSASANWLLGGDGNDFINGAGGNDMLFGEAGSDTFLFTRGTGGDVIGDFQHGVDKINLQAWGFGSFETLKAWFIQGVDSGAINLGNGDFIVLHNVDMGQLDAGDFIL